MMVDLAAEYLAALCETTQKSLRPLLDAGATERALALAVPALANVQLHKNNLFEPDPHSNTSAFILPVRVDYPETPESIDPRRAITEGAIVDLVAFTPALRVRWALRTGAAEWLGACLPQYMEPEPVKLCRTPFDWLRGDCEGLVCLATIPIEIYRFLTRLRVINVEDEEHAEQLHAILDRPVFNPEIVVTGRHDNGR